MRTAAVYAAPVAAYEGCNACGGWVRERLPDPEQQYYYVDQGPTYTGPRLGAASGLSRSSSRYGYGYNRPYRAHRYYHRHHAAGYYNGQRVLRRYYSLTIGEGFQRPFALSCGRAFAFHFIRPNRLAPI